MPQVKKSLQLNVQILHYILGFERYSSAKIYSVQHLNGITVMSQQKYRQLDIRRFYISGLSPGYQEKELQHFIIDPFVIKKHNTRQVSI
jgi:hypothetical protein